MELELKGLIDGISTNVAAFDTKLSDLQRQVDAIDQKGAGRMFAGGVDDGAFVKAVTGQFDDIRKFAEGRHGYMRIQVGSFDGEIKTVITSDALGRQTTGVVTIDRRPDIVPLATRRVFMRDVLSKDKTTEGLIDFVRENTNSLQPTGSPQTEGSTKWEGAVTFTSHSERVQTIATWIPASRQALMDMDSLSDFLQSRLLYAIRMEEDRQILYGAGTGVNLNGLVTQATAFNTALLRSGVAYQFIDIARRALQQVERSDEEPAGFFVLHPDDWASVELMKDSQGRYLFGDPAVRRTPMLWGKPVVVTPAMTSGTFLVGNGSSAQILDRMEATLDISFEDGNNFTKNLVTLRAESRLALVTYRPTAFITGSFSSSPTTT